VLAAIVAVRSVLRIPVLIAHPKLVASSLYVLIVAAGAGAIGGFAYSLIGRRLLAIPVVGRYLTGIVCVAAYLLPLIFLLPRVLPGTFDQ